MLGDFFTQKSANDADKSGVDNIFDFSLKRLEFDCVVVHNYLDKMRIFSDKIKSTDT